MSQPLPSKANLKHLKNQARQLLDAQKLGDEDACTRFKAYLPRLSDASDEQVQGANLYLRDAQLVVAREYGFTSWPKLKHHLDALPRAQPEESPHQVILKRIAQIVAERTEEASGVIRHLLRESPEQAAIVMIALGQETTAEVMKFFTDAEIEWIAQSISELSAVTTQQEDEVLEAFEQLIVAGKYLSQGGVDFARGALSKAVGERKAQAILKRIGAEHKRVLTRVKQLVSERPQDVARVLVQEEPDRAAMLVQILGEEALSEVPDPVATEIVGVAAGRDEVNKEDAVEVLEAFERVLMVLKYVANGGVKFAQGALEKSLGPRKTQALFDRATGMSGFLKLRHLASDQVREVVSGESTETIAAVLSQLESVQAIGVLHGLDSKVQADVIGRLNAGSDVSPETRRDLDAWLADRVDTVIES